MCMFSIQGDAHQCTSDGDMSQSNNRSTCVDLRATVCYAMGGFDPYVFAKRTRHARDYLEGSGGMPHQETFEKIRPPEIESESYVEQLCKKNPLQISP